MEGVRKVGQHKYNPTAIAAKNGEIKPRKKLTRSEQKKLFYGKLAEYMPPLPTKRYFK